MLLVARGELDTAERHARAGAAEQDRQARSGNRFPAIGCHWLLGAIQARTGRHTDAIAAFEREIEQADPGRLYGPEYAAVALNARGHAELASGRAEDARRSFQAAHHHVADYARASIGEAAALERLGRSKEADEAWRAAERGRERLEHTGRTPEALLVGACAAAMRGDAAAATMRLERFLANVPPSHLGWTMAIEPCFAGLEADAGFRRIADEMARRAQ
jgi:tetratricopeptide (TPR) repeat protein